MLCINCQAAAMSAKERNPSQGNLLPSYASSEGESRGWATQGRFANRPCARPD